MAQPASSPRIDELRSRLRAEPNSRMFYLLAEELRKAGQHAEAEQVLRSGLANHQTYLAAWVSLGRVLRDLKRDADAIDPLVRAMQLDPENLVAARLLGDCYASVGEKVEAIKKYKLVQALMPGDEDLDLLVDNLDREINPAVTAPLADEEQPGPSMEAEPAALPAVPEEAEEESLDLPGGAEPGWTEASLTSPFAAPEPEMAAFEESLPIESAAATAAEEREAEAETADSEPMLAAHSVSPFEEPLPDYSAAALEIEAPAGVHIARAPLSADVPSFAAEEALPPVDAAASSPHEFLAPSPDLFDDGAAAFEESPSGPQAAEVEEWSTAAEPAPDVFAPAEEPFDGDETASIRRDQLTDTITMADLYVRQGLIDDAKHIYESILLRDPGNAGVRTRLELLSPTSPPEPEASPAIEARPGSPSQRKIEKLEQWLSKVTRREVGDV